MLPETIDGKAFDNRAVSGKCYDANKFTIYLGLVKSLVMVVCWFWVSMQVLCARYSDEEFFRVRCKG